VLPVNKQEDKYVKISGKKVRYWSGGDKGKNVILIHGIGGSVEIEWLYTFGPLSEHNRVYGLDLPGFGLSDRPQISYFLEGMARSVKDFMDVLKIDRAVIVGVSMGGGVALQFAIQFQDRLDKLVIVDSAGLGRKVSPVFKILSIPGIGSLLMKPGLSNSERGWKSSVYDPSCVKKDLVENDYKLAVIPGFRRSFLKTLRNGCGIRGVRPRVYKTILDGLGSIKSQTLIIWGKQDPLIPVEHAYIADEKIPGSQLHIFDKCGHVPPVEYPEEFVNIVSEFISR
jgi:4,5:9,10-diseco-3-hydroxy-5,9,17-trioxoandrosta-1(10),2-diene-4-oate hydrolase